jgi:hypothetical protein
MLSVTLGLSCSARNHRAIRSGRSTRFARQSDARGGCVLTLWPVARVSCVLGAIGIVAVLVIAADVLVIATASVGSMSWWVAVGYAAFMVVGVVAVMAAAARR